MAPRELPAQAERSWCQHFCPHPAKLQLVLCLNRLPVEPPKERGSPNFHLSCGRGLPLLWQTHTLPVSASTAAETPKLQPCWRGQRKHREPLSVPHCVLTATPSTGEHFGGQKGKREGKESTSLDSSKRKSLSHLPGSLQNIFTILTPSCPDGTATETPNYGGEFASRTRKSFNFTQATDSNGVSFGSQGSAAWWTDTTPRPYTHSNSEVSQGLGLIHNLQPALHSQRDHRNPT